MGSPPGNSRYPGGPLHMPDIMAQIMTGGGGGGNTCCCELLFVPLLATCITPWPFVLRCDTPSTGRWSAPRPSPTSRRPSLPRNRVAVTGHIANSSQFQPRISSRPAVPRPSSYQLLQGRQSYAGDANSTVQVRRRRSTFVGLFSNTSYYPCGMNGEIFIQVTVNCFWNIKWNRFID